MTEESCKSYVQGLGRDALRRVRVGRHPKLSSAECFYINHYSSRFRCKIPFYFTLHQLNLIEGDFADLIGRTPWGPWCLISVYRFGITNVKILTDPLEDKRVIGVIDYIKDYEN